MSKFTALKQWPVGFPSAENDFEVLDSTTFTVDPITHELKEGEVVVELKYVSVDPYMRARMVARNSELTGHSSFTLHEPMEGHAVGIVIKSNSPKANPGDAVVDFFKFDRFQVVNLTTPSPWMQVLPNAAQSPVPLPYYISLFGMPGLTAYLGLMKLCQPKSGETLYVSAASGAVGQLVGQIGKILGLRVIGSAGADDKVAYLKNELKFDDAFNYKKCGEKGIEGTLKEMCPKGIDCYFENVGGETLDAVLNVANRGARIAVCGMISQYNAKPGEQYGCKNLMNVVAKELRIEGFLVPTLVEKYGSKDGIEEMGKWLKEGMLNYKVDILSGGMEAIPKAMVRMLKGENFGKQVVEIV